MHFDNYFTSLDLMTALYHKDTNATGTMRQNREGYSGDLKNTKVKHGEMIERQKGSIVATRWHDKREVSLLTTNTEAELMQFTSE